MITFYCKRKAVAFSCVVALQTHNLRCGVDVTAQVMMVLL